MARTVEFYIEKVEAAIEAGFLSMAAKKRANDDISQAYSLIERQVRDAILNERKEGMADESRPWTETDEKANHELYWFVPMQISHVREKHFEALAKYEVFEQVRDLITYRQMVKEAEILPVPVKEETKKVEAIRKSIIEEMEARKAQFVHGLEVARLFKGLPVSVNAHWVYGHKGTKFIRHFFYYAGKLTPLNMIIAIAEAYNEETK